MTELIRPMLYNAFHRIEPVVQTERRADGRATSSGRSARAATRSARIGRCRARRSAICSPSSTPAPTDRSWPPTTTAGCCRPRCSSRTARRVVIRRRQTLDDLLALEIAEIPASSKPQPMTGLLIAFEGLDQSGKQTQAERLKAARRGARADVPCCSTFPTTKRTSAGNPRGAARRARLRRRRDAAALRREPLREEAADRDDCSPPGRWSSAIATSRRASPTAKRRARRRVAARDPALPAAAGPDDPARHRAGDRGRHGRPPNRDKYERDLALLSRVRESYRRQAAAGGWLRLDGERAEGRRRRRRRHARSRQRLARP